MQADTPLVSAFEPSPNFGERKLGIDMLILHYTATKSADEAICWLCNEESQVSAHYLIDEKGKITQMVREADRAWHAGLSSWQGQTDTNSRSIGIEIQHEADAPTPYKKKQINSLIHLTADILKRNPHIPAHHVLGHSDVAVGRKQDPGAWFPWEDLARAGIGLYVRPHPIVPGPFLQLNDQGQPIEALQSMLALYGYGVEINGIYDEHTQKVVKAFQMHFRPEKVDGIADRSTIETLVELLRSIKK